MANTLWVPHHLYWDVDGQGDIGAASGSSRPNNVYIKGYLEIGEIATPGNASSGTQRLYFNSTDHLLHYINSVGADSAVGVTQFPLLANPSGTAASPAYSFASATGNGLYLQDANNLGLSTAGIERVTIGKSSDSGGQIAIWNTSAAAISGTISAIDTRLFIVGQGQIAMGTGTYASMNRVLDINPTDVTVRSGNVLLVPNGSVGAPSYSFSAHPTAGMYYSSALNVGFDASDYMSITGNSANIFAVNNFGVTLSQTNGSAGVQFVVPVSATAGQNVYLGIETGDVANRGEIFIEHADLVWRGGDNLFDIGRDGGSNSNYRPRSLYLGTSVVLPLLQGYDEISSASTVPATTTLRGGNQTVASGTANGGDLVVRAGSPTGAGTTGTGGTLFLQGGSVPNSNANSGAVSIQLGNYTGGYFTGLAIQNDGSNGIAMTNPDNKHIRWSLNSAQTTYIDANFGANSRISLVSPTVIEIDVGSNYLGLNTSTIFHGGDIRVDDKSIVWLNDGIGDIGSIDGGSTLKRPNKAWIKTSITVPLVTGLSTPVGASDAANKGYVDSLASGLDLKASVRVATTAALPAVTYANGTGGVGATLTSNTNVSINPLDGVTLVVGNRILVKDQAAGLQNGIYTVTQVGSGAAPFILTRATDADDNSGSFPEVTSGMYTFVEEGAVNAGFSYILTTANPITIGTTALVFGIFSNTGGGANRSLSNLTSPTAINQSLLFGSDATNDIGASGASRPANIRAATAFYVGVNADASAPYFKERTGVPGQLEIHAGNNQINYTIGATTVLTSTNYAGHLFDIEIAFGTDNTIDIGRRTDDAAAARPRNIYVGTSILNANGTVSLPSYSFQSNPNTGMYRVAANSIGFATNGTSAISIDGSQNLNFLQTTGRINFTSNANNWIDASQNNRMHIHGHTEIDFSLDAASRSIVISALDIEVAVDFLANVDNVVDFGFSAAVYGTTKVRFRDGYLSRDLYLGGTAAGSAASTSKIYFGSVNTTGAWIGSGLSDAQDLRLHSGTGARIAFQVNNGTNSLFLYGSAGTPAYWFVNQSFSPDNSLDIGNNDVDDAVNRARPKNIYAGTDLYLGGTADHTVVGADTSNSHIYFGSRNTATSAISNSSSTMTVKVGGSNLVNFYNDGTEKALEVLTHICMVADNSFDIGNFQGGLTDFGRPRNVYIGTSVRAPDGSNSVPPYTFTSDTTLGFYRVGSGTIGFASATNQRLQFGAAVAGSGPSYIQNDTSNNMIMEAGGGQIFFQVRNVNAAVAYNDGTEIGFGIYTHLFFGTDNLYDIGNFQGGLTDFRRPRNIYMGGFVEMIQIASPTSATSGTDRLYFKAGDGLFSKNSSGVEAQYLTSLSGANILLSNLSSPTAINQDLLFGADASKNIGAAGASRPNNVYIASSLFLGGATVNEVSFIPSVISGTSTRLAVSSPGTQGEITFYINGTYVLDINPGSVGINGDLSMALATSRINFSSNANNWIDANQNSRMHIHGHTEIDFTVDALVRALTIYVGGVYVTSDLSFADATTDIGFRTSDTTRDRPRDIFTSRDLYLGGTQGGSNTSTSKIYFGSQNTASAWLSSSVQTLAQATTPANPVSGFDSLYFKSGDGLFSKNSAGTEVQYISTGIVSIASLGYLQDAEALQTFTLVAGTTANIESWAFASFSSIQIEYSIKNATSGAMESGYITLVTDGVSTDISKQATAVIGVSNIVFNSSISGSNLVLSYTSTDANNATFKYTVRKWLA